MAEKKEKLTGSNTHVATEPGFHRRVIAAGEFVPADIPVSDTWMKPVKKGDRDVIDAANAALNPHPDDVPLEDLSKPALEAMATERGIPVADLSKDDLISAIKAARATTA